VIQTPNTKFVIFGDWDTTPTPGGKIRIVMPPLGHLDGAGWSPFTQSGLQALENDKQRVKGSSFAEIGAGTGILCVAARLLGAKRIIATELDPDAVAVIPQVFAANGITDNFLVVNGTYPPEHVNIALCSISTEFGQQQAAQIDADHILSIENVKDGGQVIVIK